MQSSIAAFIAEPACVHCGLCLEACPTYALEQNEAESPRGRIHLLAALADGRLPLTAETAAPIDSCLGCLACETACPSGVVYRHVLEEGRERIAAQVPRGARGWLFHRVLLGHVLPFRNRLRAFLRAGQIAQSLGILALMRRFRPLLPPLPRGLGSHPPAFEPARSARRGRAGLLSGCAGAAFFPDVNRAAVQLLAAAGWDVVVPPEQGCCGALHAHTGDIARAAAFAEANVQPFADCDVIVTTAAGCGAHLRGAGHARARDLTVVLAEAWAEAPPAFHSDPITVAWQDPCHLTHGQGVRTEPKRLLELAGCRVLEAVEAGRCCGAAGTYFLTQPETSKRLLDAKLADLQRGAPQVIVTANPGCLLQLRAGRPEVPVEHIATFLHRRMIAPQL